MSILLIGSEGSMGKRYQAILKYLGQPVFNIDKEHDSFTRKMLAQDCEGIIIATPTDTHLEIIREMIPYKKPILCEKPITKNLSELRELFFELKTENVPFQMMYQYRFLMNGATRGGSIYDYFRHGNDGLIWDCLQIIGLSKESPLLKEESPFWRCQINGYPLRLDSMDHAYITATHAWLKGEYLDLSALYDTHQKVAEFKNAS